MLLVFSNVEITPKFSVNHNKSQKLYFEPQIFTQEKNISSKETFDQISFQKKVLHSWHSNVIATQKVSHILSHSLMSHSEPPDQ